jgi:ADP-ribose pyrophosphatase YjhB (NUDIX family)
MLDQAGVVERITADIVGHAIQTMTYGVYSAGSSMQQKQDAIEKLEYPPLPELTKKRLDRIVPLSNPNP